MADAIQCVVVTPETTLLDEAAEFVAVPLIDGEAGIARDHAPMIGRLGCGEVRITAGGKPRSYFVDGGFVQVNQNQVSVITGHALSATEINVGDVEQELKQAESSAPSSKEEKLARDRAIAQAKAKLKVAAK